MSASVGMYIGVILIGGTLFWIYRRQGGFFKCLLFTACTGLLALGGLWLLGKVVAVPITLTPLTLLLSAILGVPGVLGMLLLSLL